MLTGAERANNIHKHIGLRSTGVNLVQRSKELDIIMNWFAYEASTGSVIRLDDAGLLRRWWAGIIQIAFAGVA